LAELPERRRKPFSPETIKNCTWQFTYDCYLIVHTQIGSDMYKMDYRGVHFVKICHIKQMGRDWWYLYFTFLLFWLKWYFGLGHGASGCSSVHLSNEPLNDFVVYTLTYCIEWRTGRVKGGSECIWLS
jgi:hypothetical protein